MESRVKQLAQNLKSAALDAVIIPPSGDMHFYFGFSPAVCERFQAVVVTAHETVFCITNLLYKEDMEKGLPDDTPVYAWDDAGSFVSAVKQAFDEHHLTQGRVGINAAVRAVDLMDLEQRFPQCRFVNADPVIAACRIIKTPEQIDLMKQAGARADETMEELKGIIRPGMTEKQVKQYILDSFAQKGLEPAFTPIVASGTNNSRPHYNRDDRVITPKDVIILDFGCKVNGFCSDTSRTFFVGEPGEREKQIYAIVKAAFEAAVRTVRQGVTAGQVDQSARQVIQKAGFGEFFINRTGHGIGMDVHEQPYIKGNNSQILEPGMAFSIEPGIYIPGEVGMRIEDIVIVDENGEAQSLNHSARDLVIL
jgi:Xaa-Pro dipeptidase